MRVGKLEWAKDRLDVLQRMLDGGMSPKECGFALSGKLGIKRIVEPRAISQVIGRHELRHNPVKVEKR